MANNYVSAANSFRRFLAERNIKDVLLDELTSVFMSDYESWLQGNGLCKNTTSFYIRALQSVYNKAVRCGIVDDRLPFSGTYRGVARTVKRAVTPVDISRLCSLDIKNGLIAYGMAEGRQFDALLRKLEFERDIFVFCFCARGLTFVDLAYMSKSNVTGNVMVYVRRKTKQRIEVQIEPMMQDIISRYPSDTDYLFPILTKTGGQESVYRQYRYALMCYNSRLGLLGKLMGGLKLTSYVSRHSWASAARLHNVPLSVISQSMGHDSEKTTEIYLKSLESNVINAANHDLLNSVFRTSGK